MDRKRAPSFAPVFAKAAARAAAKAPALPVLARDPGPMESDPTPPPQPPQLPLDAEAHSFLLHTPVGSSMTTTQIATALASHDCVDLTQQLDPDSCSLLAVSNGGFGDIYRGKLLSGTQVAIKVFRLHVLHHSGGKHLKHAARELYTWSKCQHPNVLRLLGLVQFKEQIGMVSPWVDGGDVKSYLSRHPNTNRRQMCYAVSDGLAYLHGIDIIHGDLKGANVLVSSAGTPLLTDFGNSLLSEHSLQFTTTTTKSSVSLRWTAPEVLEGSVTISYPADVFALGMTILEIITGDVPYHELQRDQAVITAILVRKKVPTRPEAHIPTDGKHEDILWSLLLQCWAFEPEHRPKAGLVRDMMSDIAKLSDMRDIFNNLVGLAAQLGPSKSTQTADESPAEGTSTSMGNTTDRPEEEVGHE